MKINKGKQAMEKSRTAIHKEDKKQVDEIKTVVDLLNKKLDLHIKSNEEQFNLLSSLADPSIIQSLRDIIEEKKADAYANKKIAKYTRTFLAIVAGVGVVIATTHAIIGLVFRLKE